jgi:cytoskeleton protein RodZ
MNTHTTSAPDAPAEAPRANGPGSQLRQARLDLKLAPEDVATMLHLSSRQIVALENDDYANLPGPTYIRGYLRGYAQLLGVSSEPLVESYNRTIAARKPVDLGKLSPRPEIRSDHRLVKFATLGVIAVVIGLSAVWWQEKPVPEEPVPLPSAPVGVEDDIVLPPERDSEGSVSPGSDTPPAVATPTPAPVEPAAPAVVPAPAAEPPRPAITGPSGRLVLQTTLDCWADVRDANGERLLYDTIPAGRTVAVEGVLPLAVFLGNAEGVRVEFNGRSYDVERHRRGEFARFTLNERGSSTQ